GAMTRGGRVRTLGLALAWGAALVGASGRTETPVPKATGPQEGGGGGGLVNPQTDQPTGVFPGKPAPRPFAPVRGPAEATGIALPLRNLTPPRPLTHDLFLTLFGRLHVSVRKAVITDLRDDIYYATVYLNANGGEITLDSRPSDAIALAIRAKAPVYV